MSPSSSTAKLAGYAEFAVRHRMAQSVERVQGFLGEVKAVVDQREQREVVEAGTGLGTAPLPRAHRSEPEQDLPLGRLARRQLDEAGHAYSHVDLGAMVEVPAAALSLAQFLRHFDFVSIGTNDLIQYTLAIDRADDAVSHLYDPWHPAVIGLIAEVIARANAADKGVSVCGEMAGDPAFTELLLAMGLRSFSMHPAQIPSIKQRILRADTRRLSVALDRVLTSDDPQSESTRAFAAGVQ